MDHFSNSAALSAAAAASAASGSPPGSGLSSSAVYSNQAAVHAAIGSSLEHTTAISSPSSYSLNPSSGNLGNSNGQQHSSSSPTSNISHNHASAALLASQVRVLLHKHTLFEVGKWQIFPV
jgi:hypothetical protein